jgi:hypothetical protein
MPVARKFPALKVELIKIITENIGSKTADMYSDFYDANSPDVALASAEELLVEFIGKQRAVERIAPLRQQFNLSKALAV